MNPRTRTVRHFEEKIIEKMKFLRFFFENYCPNGGPKPRFLEFSSDGEVQGFLAKTGLTTAPSIKYYTETGNCL